MPEWTNGVVPKTTILARVSEVRILLPPPMRYILIQNNPNEILTSFAKSLSETGDFEVLSYNEATVRVLEKEEFNNGALPLLKLGDDKTFFGYTANLSGITVSTEEIIVAGELSGVLSSGEAGLLAQKYYTVSIGSTLHKARNHPRSIISKFKKFFGPRTYFIPKVLQILKNYV